MLEKFLGSSLESFKRGKISSNPSAIFSAKVFDIIESLWLLQVVKEKQFDSWYSQHLENRGKEEEKLLSMIASKQMGLRERDPVRFRCQEELQTFYDRYETQNCLLEAVLNKDFYELLVIQEHVLSKIGLPFFTDGFTSLILNSVGSVPDDKKTFEVFEKQRVILGALLSLKLCTEDGLMPPTTSPAPSTIDNRKRQMAGGDTFQGANSFLPPEPSRQRARTKRRRSSSNEANQQLSMLIPAPLYPPPGHPPGPAIYSNNPPFYPASHGPPIAPNNLLIAPSLDVIPVMFDPMSHNRDVPGIGPIPSQNLRPNPSQQPRLLPKTGGRGGPPALDIYGPGPVERSRAPAGRGASAVMPAWMKKGITAVDADFSKPDGNQAPSTHTQQHQLSKAPIQQSVPTGLSVSASPASGAQVPVSDTPNLDRKSALLQKLAGMVKSAKK
jgi:hypothetical protein